MVRFYQKLFVSNLPWTVGTTQLKTYIQKEFGRVFSVNVIFDKKTGLSQRYGFVSVPQETLEKIEKKEKHQIEGTNIYFKPQTDASQAATSSSN